jgi:hypothetical protein
MDDVKGTDTEASAVFRIVAPDPGASLQEGLD